MYDGVKAMITKEKEYAKQNNAIVSSALTKPEDLKYFPIFPAGTKSLLMKFLTP